MSVAHPISGYSLSQVMFVAQVLDTPVVNTTEFHAPFHTIALGSTEADHQIIIPRGMTLHSLTVEHSNAQAVTVMVVTIKANTTDTAVTLDIPIAVGGFTQDLVNRAHVNAGDELGVSFASQAGATNAVIRSFSFLGDLDG